MNKLLSVRLVSLALFISWVISFLPGDTLAQKKPIAPGGSFPALTFKDILSQKEQLYLGIQGKKAFSVADIQGNLLIFQIFSTFCMSCPSNVPVLNAVYSAIKDDPKLREKIKVIGVAVGNTRNEAEVFKKEYKALYPILTDFRFAIHKALGNPRVPYTIIVKRDAKGKYVAAFTYMGVLESSGTLLNEVRNLLGQKSSG